MDREEHHDRTLRLLESKLEALAHVSEHSVAGKRRVAAEVDAVAAATRRAIDLDLISPTEADEVWERVESRHPDAGWRRQASRAA